MGHIGLQRVDLCLYLRGFEAAQWQEDGSRSSGHLIERDPEGDGVFRVTHHGEDSEDWLARYLAALNGIFEARIQRDGERAWVRVEADPGEVDLSPARRRELLEKWFGKTDNGNS